MNLRDKKTSLPNLRWVYYVIDLKISNYLNSVYFIYIWAQCYFANGGTKLDLEHGCVFWFRHHVGACINSYFKHKVAIHVICWKSVHWTFSKKNISFSICSFSKKVCDIPLKNDFLFMYFILLYGYLDPRIPKNRYKNFHQIFNELQFNF